MINGRMTPDQFRLFDNLDALGRAAFGSLTADILELGRDILDDDFGRVAIHLEDLGAKIDADLVPGAEVFVYCHSHLYSFRVFLVNWSSQGNPRRGEPRGFIFILRRNMEIVLPLSRGFFDFWQKDCRIVWGI
jgi:hypothetical protein